MTLPTWSPRRRNWCSPTARWTAARCVICSSLWANKASRSPRNSTKTAAITEADSREPLARVALAYVGANPQAAEVFHTAVLDQTLSRTIRRELVEDLNQDGLSNKKNPTPEDLKSLRTATRSPRRICSRTTCKTTSAQRRFSRSGQGPAQHAAAGCRCRGRTRARTRTVNARFSARRSCKERAKARLMSTCAFWSSKTPSVCARL